MTNEMYERTLKQMLIFELEAELQDTIDHFLYVGFYDLDKISFHEYYDEDEEDNVIGFTAVADLLDLDLTGQPNDCRSFENIVCVGYICAGAVTLKTVACNGKVHYMRHYAENNKLDLR